VLNPTKNRAGNRVYRTKDIELLLLVKHLLYEQKYTIEGANKRLSEMRTAGELEGERQEVLSPEFLAGMKGDLEKLLQVLTPKAPLAAD
jgi:DNA-binding transcriptional MerR regulator